MPDSANAVQSTSQNPRVLEPEIGDTTSVDPVSATDQDRAGEDFDSSAESLDNSCNSSLDDTVIENIVSSK